MIGFCFVFRKVMSLALGTGGLAGQLFELSAKELSRKV